MPILKHPNSGRLSPGAMTTHIWGAAVSICPADSATAGEGLSSRKSSAKPTLNVKTEIQDVMLHNLHAMRRDNRTVWKQQSAIAYLQGAATALIVIHHKIAFKPHYRQSS